MQKFIDLRSGGEFVPHSSLVLCLGTFDGVHRGHMALIEETLRQKSLLCDEYPDILGGAWCFSQPPADFLFERSAPHITTLDRKLELFAEAGLDVAVVGDFPTVRRISHVDFINSLLRDECRCVKAVCGFNFRFGNGALGTPDDLSALPRGCVTLPRVTFGDVTVSSSEIRRRIADGRIEEANEMLGRPFSFDLPVIHGKSLGRHLGAPTINQQIPKESLIPAHGVYASRATVGGETYVSITNIGTNPTVSDGDAIHCETHLLNFKGDLYGERVTTELLKFLRPERRFGSKTELSEAIASDIASAKKYFDLV